MDQASLESNLAELHLPGIRYLDSIDSTNNEAWRWFDAGAPAEALVIADTQTAGRGRMQRHWVSAPGAGLAFSLILTFPPLEAHQFSHLTGLGALATCLALQNHYSLAAQIKWPNDILLEDRKTAGVLAEARWNGEDLTAAVIGIGINIAPLSISPELLPTSGLNFPATCIENVLGHPVERMEVLRAVLGEFFSWLPRLHSVQFIRTWERNLAYLGEWVELSPGNQSSAHFQDASSVKVIGKVTGLGVDGSLQLSTRSGELITAHAGEIHLRPAD